MFAQAEHVRLSTDCILLADFVKTGQAHRGIDLGCASGAIALLLMSRSPGLHMTGLEIQENAAELARENMARNGWELRSNILAGDIRNCRSLFPAGSFDLAVTNPPYYRVGSGALSPDAAKAGARGETDCSLAELCAAAAWLLHTGGSFCLVYKPERLSELLYTMHEANLEPKRLRMVCHRQETAPSLVLVEGRRGGRPGMKVEPNLFLTGPDGGESDEYRRIYHR